MPAEPAAYRPVIVIPVYNHPATVEDVVRRLLSTGTPVLLVDDASDPPAQEACERCRAMGADLVRRQSTGGRGASILTGFKAARQAGFTHALVFDAGGRHDPAAVGSFLELSRKHPNDLVCGYARTSSAYPAR
ncbi:MAG: glycosyltransferase, partial [Sutterella wadsworthensis]